MPKHILIDATFPEETRLAVIDGNRLLAFESDAGAGDRTVGNIYLAQVVRVEPALESCFVDYGGPRHGFLPLSDIHPDYFQIPESRREQLLSEVRESDAREASEQEHRCGQNGEASGSRNGDIAEDFALSRQEILKQYSIAELIRGRPVMLVQVTKESRDTKGAVLTTYLSLAGRYCIYMPNTAGGGGVSRKITQGKDRSRLKAIAKSLDVPVESGLIIRTLGSGIEEEEIVRDYESLRTQWDEVTETTVTSNAPCLIHDQSSLIRRVVRDLFDSNTKQIVVQGEDTFQATKSYMQHLAPNFARRVRAHTSDIPIFVEHGVEKMIEDLFTPKVKLPSGGTLVISPTEALTAIDVNSGRSTRDSSVEQTALRTNLEAAAEIARQLRLRDIAGLVVIDFIDMDKRRNRANVEEELKDALKDDRARVQIGKISNFGLLEMSRQRLQRSMLEATMARCPACAGRGMIRSAEAVAQTALRSIESEAAKEGTAILSVHPDVASILLNDKRRILGGIEDRRGISIRVQVNDKLPVSTTQLKWEPPVETSEEGAKRQRRRPSKRLSKPVKSIDASDDVGLPPADSEFYGPPPPPPTPPLPQPSPRRRTRRPPPRSDASPMDI